nr:Toll/interleukin-1 receptor (TIR) domain-containing protein [Tanacetum cinerariifolium]
GELAVVEAVPRDFKSSAVYFPSSLVMLSLANNNLSNESFPMDLSCLSMLKELCLDGVDDTILCSLGWSNLDIEISLLHPVKNQLDVSYDLGVVEGGAQRQRPLKEEEDGGGDCDESGLLGLTEVTEMLKQLHSTLLLHQSKLKESFRRARQDVSLASEKFHK